MRRSLREWNRQDAAVRIGQLRGDVSSKCFSNYLSNGRRIQRIQPFAPTTLIRTWSSHVNKLRKNRPRSLQYEALESREMMAVTAAFKSRTGALTITSNDASDAINFRQYGTTISVAGVTGSWSASKVKSITVNLNGGNDSVSLNSWANGGNTGLAESITIRGGLGNEVVHMANGQDVNFSGVGQTLTVSPTGVAILNGIQVNFTNSVQLWLNGGVLNYYGTNGNDSLKFQQWNDWIGLEGMNYWVPVSMVNSIVVHLQDGDDYVSLDSIANNCDQVITKPVTINAGLGSKSVDLANGHNLTFSGYGRQLKVSATGVVTLDGVVQSFNTPTPPTPPPPPPPATNWFDSNITDAALRTLGHNLYLDGLIDRNDMIALLRNTEDSGVIDATELNDLRNIQANASLFGTQVHVQKLAGYIVNGSVANAKYQGASLGGFGAGSADTQLEKLINKWFLGLDRPNATDPYGMFSQYRQFAGQLFVNGATYDDINQGAVGDCYFLAALAEAALRSNSTITNMFIVNGDGTYTVKFYGYSGVDYVTVDSFLPTNWNGNLYYATRGLNYANAAGELWVALAEKAYAQLNEFGWSRPGSYNGQNSYTALSGGYIYAALGHVTGQSTTPFTMTSTGFQTFVNAWNAGKSIGFASYSSPPAGSGVVGGHAYAVIGYNAANQTVTLYNPWGLNNGQAPGTLTLTWTQITQSFQYFDRTA